MQSTEKINFIISGIRDGFKRSHISNNDISEVINFISDIRQITNVATENFYSIEKTQNYTLVTIFNPHTIDYIDRKAYIAITLFVKNEFVIQGDIIGALNHLMNYYEQKQANDFNSLRFTEEMFEAEYANLTVEKNTTTESAIRNKQGYIVYDQISEIVSHLESPAINGFQKVYLLSTNNINVANQLVSFEKITAFPKAVVYKVADFANGFYDVFINNQTYSTAGKLDMHHLTINANQGDVIAITHKASKISHNIVASYPGQTLQLHDYFPKVNTETSNRPGPIGGNNPNRGTIPPKPESPKLNKALLIMIGVLVPVVIGLVIYSIMEKAPPPPTPPTVQQSAPVQPTINDTSNSTSTAQVNSSTSTAGASTGSVSNTQSTTTRPNGSSAGSTNPNNAPKNPANAQAVRGVKISNTGAGSPADNANKTATKVTTTSNSSGSGKKSGAANCPTCNNLKAEIDGESDMALKRGKQKELKAHQKTANHQ